MWRVCVRGLVFLSVLVVTIDVAPARPQYLAQFGRMYPEFPIKKETRCAICHCGTSKKGHNDYGEAIEKMLDGKNVKDRAAIEKALRIVERDPSKVHGKTFGDLIRAGKMPGVCPDKGPKKKRSAKPSWAI